ncbi:KpsF/GutQ family sugar-phosphate isomerase [Siccirubricoccus sp. KC 17139]|uniref:KpsF/GutQ family sugar-phosphate isomerase n=1 Tax=Siccirubricoccus soli TaxID=2899147 RepID=A0ABT1D206_9PROT|nr:KpsF/GutQ family sugar-phosphate isomerase [Siccirubricoccus soli]MCO6415933.1 KpsF/GutQ family sugar-phosphate isomerase [Siccirubricoccus soli]MCP2682065.1 KpsF/GutQ family sugar-phosphate isomerase [Siccirubricoccus soli]
MTIERRMAGQPAPEQAARIRASGAATLAVESAGLQALAEALDGALGDAFAAAVETIIATSGRVVVTGMGKSGHVGNKIAATLASTGTPAFFLHPAEASHGDLGMLTAADVVLALSWSGGTAELRDIIHYTRRHGVQLIALTGGANSALAKAADILLLLPPITEACPHGLAPTTSTLIQMALGDALAMALLERRGFTPQEFAQYHPGGKLGAQLMTVGELMQKAPNLPLVEEGADMSRAILAMTGHSLGCAVVTAPDGRLAGLVTDGDLRRHMHDGILKRPVTEVMTRRPLTTEPGRIASAALKEMNERKVSQLVVLEEDRPVGVLHLHHLLSAGVA